MKLVQFLAAVLMAGFVSSHVNAQTPQVINVTGVMSSPNLVNVNNQQGTGWVGTTAYTGVGGGVSGGSSPGYNSTTNTIYFGYTQKTAAYTYALNQALRDSGMTILGYNYSWDYYNQGMSSGTLSAAVNFTGTNGVSLHSKTWALGTTTDWTTVSGTENFGDSGVAVASIANFSLSFTGKDSRFWAGYYGPMVKDPSIKLNYTVDPCVSNPLYSPNCAGYSDILTSKNIAAQSYAINQALNLSGSNVKINGLEYGYNYAVGGDWCAFSLIICLDWKPSSMDVNVSVTSNTGSTLYSAKHTHGPNTSGEPSYSYVFPTQRALSSMGDFTLSTTEVGTTALYSSWSRWQYTPDPCVVNPLSSSTCDGYDAAYKTQQCTANALYDPTCPGYAAAYLTQQCTVSALYDPTCPGYAAAYLTQQCTLNPLYSTTCSGYEQAYFDQQCTLDATYNTKCPGYAAAYKTKQCTANALYATDCPGYETAYFNAQCIKDSLYSTKCEGYATAYAIKYLTPISSDPTVANAVNGSLSNTAAIKANDPANTVVATNTASTTVNTDGTVSTSVSTTGNTTIDKAIAPPPPTANSAAAPAAPVQLAPPPPGPQQAQGEQGGRRQERVEKKEDGPQGDRPAKREDGPAGNQPPQMAQGQQGGERPAGPTVRDAIAERRQAVARAEAVEKGKNLANEMGKVADMEQQKQIQNVVIQAMGFTPGFDVYGKAMLPDGVGYKPFTVYNNQRTIDNRSALRMFGGADRLHNEMVDLQYKEK
jgi:hypothetical protein